MGKPLLLAENVYNLIQFPGHFYSPGDPVPGRGPEKVGTARRSPLSVYEDATPGDALVAQITFDRVRSVDTVVVDRNWSGDVELIRVRARKGGSPGEWQDVVPDLPRPTEVVLGSSLNDPLPVLHLTEEGAIVIRFEEVACTQLQVQLIPEAVDGIPLMGGLYVGKSWTPALGARLPWDDEAGTGLFSLVRPGLPNNDWRTVRSISLNVMLYDEPEYNEHVRRLRQNLLEGHPVWVVPDSDYAERAGLFYLETGALSVPIAERPQSRSMTLPLTEYHPRLR